MVVNHQHNITKCTRTKISLGLRSAQRYFSKIDPGRDGFLRVWAILCMLTVAIASFAEFDPYDYKPFPDTEKMKQIRRSSVGVIDSLFTIRRDDGAEGTGFLFSEWGRKGEKYILTANHLVANEVPFEIITSKGTKLKPVRIDADRKLDLAKIYYTQPDESQYIFSKCMSTNMPAMGDKVFIYGNKHMRQDITRRITCSDEGIISLVTESELYITAPIDLGNSGSPVLDKEGFVIGMITSKLIPPLKINGTTARGVAVRLDMEATIDRQIEPVGELFTPSQQPVKRKGIRSGNTNGHIKLIFFLVIGWIIIAIFTKVFRWFCLNLIKLVKGRKIKG